MQRKHMLLHSWILFWYTILPVIGFTTPTTTTTNTSNNNNDSSTDTCPHPMSPSPLNIPLLQERIAQGRVYQQPHFFSSQMIDVVLQEIYQLKTNGAFTPSGLSNTAKGSQQSFGQQDRMVCVVPWWKEMLLLQVSSQNDHESYSSSSLSSFPLTIQSVAQSLQQLRIQLAQILNRPTMADATLAHECYYSWSETNSYLPRHMDERHEELKGSKGWLLPSRRSLSWLIYLSDENWTLEQNGGALRSFPQNIPPHYQQQQQQQQYLSSQHDGNLQIGWLHTSSSSSSLSPPKAVYLNSWYRSTESNEPHCILYTVQEQQQQQQQDNKSTIQYLTRPWLNDALQGMSTSEFLTIMKEKDSDATTTTTTLFVTSKDAIQFNLLENRLEWDQGNIPKGSIIEDICPERGLLVIFDSVMLPHQVETIKQGKRIALAGWFHEETQPFPSDLFT